MRADQTGVNVRIGMFQAVDARKTHIRRGLRPEGRRWISAWNRKTALEKARNFREFNSLE
jgi:hypothetical protein